MSLDFDVAGACWHASMHKRASNQPSMIDPSRFPFLSSPSPHPAVGSNCRRTMMMAVRQYRHRHRHRHLLRMGYDFVDTSWSSSCLPVPVPCRRCCMSNTTLGTWVTTIVMSTTNSSARVYVTVTAIVTATVIAVVTAIPSRSAGNGVHPRGNRAWTGRGRRRRRRRG
jgi:hypothetical protein